MCSRANRTHIVQTVQTYFKNNVFKAGNVDMLRASQLKAGPRCTLILEVEPEGSDQTCAAVCGPHGLEHPPAPRRALRALGEG